MEWLLTWRNSVLLSWRVMWMNGFEFLIGQRLSGSKTFCWDTPSLSCRYPWMLKRRRAVVGFCVLAGTKQIISASVDGTIRLWDALSGEVSLCLVCLNRFSNSVLTWDRRIFHHIWLMMRRQISCLCLSTSSFVWSFAANDVFRLTAIQVFRVQSEELKDVGQVECGSCVSAIAVCSSQLLAICEDLSVVHRKFSFSETEFQLEPEKHDSIIFEAVDLIKVSDGEDEAKSTEFELSALFGPDSEEKKAKNRSKKRRTNSSDAQLQDDRINGDEDEND